MACSTPRATSGTMPSMPQLQINGLRVRARVGCKDSERAHPQMLEIDLRIDYDMREAITTDDVTHAVDYKSVTASIRERLASREWHLLETLTHEVATLVRDSNRTIARVEATVSKDVITDVASVSVVIAVEA